MSTVPGQDSFNDAGLAEPLPGVPPQIEGEGYEPDGPRPDLRGEAGEADVAEQKVDVPDDKSEDYPEA
jgi:hypothetical protein